MMKIENNVQISVDFLCDLLAFYQRRRDKVESLLYFPPNQQ